MHLSSRIYKIHPITERLIKKGHPWITKDQHTEKFGTNEHVILVKDSKENVLAYCLNDPKHDLIKARVWKSHNTVKTFSEHDFHVEVKDRINGAVQRRVKMDLKRDNTYLIFGEADLLPGLFLQKLAGKYILQYYSFFWKFYQKELFEFLLAELKETFPDFQDSDMWIQSRSEKYDGQKRAYQMINEKGREEFNVTEYDIKYKVVLGAAYDHGIYTDMASVRPKLKSILQKESTKSVLNMFAYTGAFSLYALKNSNADVYSVDLSGEYLDWLNENIKLNEFDESRHTTIKKDSKRAVNQFIKADKKFDLIICDPPSSFSDGKKRISSLQYYERYLTDMRSILNDGGRMVVFVNTHRLPREKVKSNLMKFIKKQNLNLQIEKDLGLGEDCPRLKNFPEGDYLKGFILKTT
jgi:23S rRNA (cytosine1962-C5)-methyltransferase